MSSNAPPKNGKSPEDDTSQAWPKAIVRDLDILIHDNWPAIHSNQPWDPTLADNLRALQARALRLEITSIPHTPSPRPESITGSFCTVSPAIPTHSLAPATTYLAAHPGTTNLLASAAVFDHQQRLLLVQRAPTDFFPLKWELSGGSVDRSENESLVAGAVRELYEETGLVSRAVTRRVWERTFEMGRWRQVVFEVGVEGVVGEEEEEGKWLEVRLDPEEHVAWLWVREEDVRVGQCGGVLLEYADEEWKALLLRAFEGRRVGEKLREFGLDGFW